MTKERFSPAQKAFLRKHTTQASYTLARGRDTYDFVRRCEQAGLVTIVQPSGPLRFPFGSWSTRLTDKGKAALGIHHCITCGASHV